MNTKVYCDMNVYDATQDRLNFVFTHYDNVLVAFSGGKDSGICLNLCYDYAVKHNCAHKLAMYHLDYEAQYSMTTEYVTNTFNSFDAITRKYWLCLPITAGCAVNMDDDFWVPWNDAQKDIWVRNMPDSKYVVTYDTLPFKMELGTADYTLQNMFCEWFSKEFGSTAVIIGIRTDESLDRFRSIVSDNKVHIMYDKQYLVGTESLTNAYIIYDWSVEDVFTAYAKYEYPYNKVYDIMYQAGVPIHKMRVASPFVSQGLDALKLYKTLEPSMWGKLIGRVNGVNFSGLYGGTTAMGWKNITLPKNHTWKSYRDFLVGTLSEDARTMYMDKFNLSEKFWKNTGGVLSERTLSELDKCGIEYIRVGKTNYKSDKDAVVFPVYPDDVNVTDFKSVPSYKRQCICIIKNDFLCKYMGFSLTKKEQERRKRVMEKYVALGVANKYHLPTN